MASETKLKPCPFCGKPPTECVTLRTWETGWKPTIQCRKCGVEIRRKTRGAAVRRWNTRKGPTDA